MSTFDSHSRSALSSLSIYRAALRRSLSSSSLYCTVKTHVNEWGERVARRRDENSRVPSNLTKFKYHVTAIKMNIFSVNWFFRINTRNVPRDPTFLSVKSFPKPYPFSWKFNKESTVLRVVNIILFFFEWRRWGKGSRGAEARKVIALTREGLSRTLVDIHSAKPHHLR